MILEYILLVIIGLSAGLLVAGGLFAFIVAIGAINKLASRTGTACAIELYEYMVIAGALIFNVIYLFSDSLIGGYALLSITGIFFGIFVGVQAMVIADVTKLTPIMFMRTKLTQGIPYIVAAMA